MNNDDISLSNSMCCYMASTEFTQFMHQTAYKNALLQLNRKKSKDKQLTLHAVWRHPIGMYVGLQSSHSGLVGDFDLERILYSILNVF